MKLGIVELDHHTECLNSLCQMLAESDIEVTVFTTYKLANELKDSDYYRQYNWQVVQKDIEQFLTASKAKFEAQDLLFFSTIESNFNLFNQLDLTVKKLIRIHNANTFLAKNNAYYFKPSLYWMFKDASYLARKVVFENEIKERNRFVEQADFVCFTSNEITDFVLGSSNFLNKEKIVNAVPITFNEVVPNQDKSPSRVFAIIGTIDRKRKNYNDFLAALKGLKIEDEVQIEVRLMGKPKGKFGEKIVRKYLDISGQKIKIKYWQNGLSQVEFDQQMSEVDVVVAPILKETKYFLVKEIYGQTKISGSINDCVKYGKMGVIPSFYSVSENKEAFFKRYTSVKDLTQVLEKFISGEWSSQLKPAVFNNFSLQQNQAQLIEMLDEIVAH